MLGFKLSGMLARSRIDRLVVVTVDGSMHCIQLHYLAEEVEKMGLIRHREHYVIEGRRLILIDPEAVRVSRFLSKVTKLLGGNTGSSNG